MNDTEKPEQPPNLFSVAILAVKNTPLILSANGESPHIANPVNPLLFSLCVFVPNLPEDLDKLTDYISRVAANNVQNELPPSYVVSLVKIAPVPIEALLKAAAQLTAEPFLHGFTPVPGTKFFHEPTEEACINTFRPGIDNHNKSPRYALMCPYCGNTALRFTGRIEARNPEGFGVGLDTNALDDLDNGADVIQHLTDGTLSGMLKKCTGVGFTLTCSLNHESTFYFIEDKTERGPETFLVIAFKEAPSLWLSPRTVGKGFYPSRIIM